MSIIDQIEIAKIRTSYDAYPKPWSEDKLGNCVLIPTLLTHIEPEANQLVETLPRQIIALLDDIEVLQDSRELSLTRDLWLHLLPTKIKIAQLPWTSTEHTIDGAIWALVSPSGTKMVVAQRTFIEHIDISIRTLTGLLSVIVAHRANPSPQAACGCGHERTSHMFLNGASPCVERPCLCQTYASR
jgi:hypothetical protein